MNLNSKLRFWARALLLTVCAALIGCYPDPSAYSGTASVEGKITLDGVPLAQAHVVFLPTQLRSGSGEIMPIAYGKCDSDGVFKLAYSNGSSELFAGKYNVLISLDEGNEPNVGREPFGDASSPSMALVNSMIARSSTEPVSTNGSQEQMKPIQKVPAIYNRVSELYFEVEASSDTVSANFDLTAIDPVLLDGR